MLPGPDGLTDERTEMVVRTIARIAAQWNTPGAVEKILPFTADLTEGILRELFEPWGRLGDSKTYARDVLGKIDYSRTVVNLPRGQCIWRCIEHLAHLRTITVLILRDDMFNLHPVANLPRLRRLTLQGNSTVSLRPLTGSRSLRVLVLDQCATMSGAGPVDLSPLRELELRRLVISGLLTKIDMASLSGLRLNSFRLESPLRGSLLPADLHVRYLSIVAGARRVGFADVCGVRSLLLDWVPDSDDLVGIARLSELRRLVLFRVPPGTPPPSLSGVKVLIISSRGGKADAT